MNEMFPTYDQLVTIKSGEPNSLNLVIKGTQSECEDIRELAYEKLDFFPYNNQIEQALLRGLNEKCELVRSDCIEIIADNSLDNYINLFIEMLNDPSIIVRFSVIEAITWTKTNKPLVNNSLQKFERKENGRHLSSGEIIRLQYAYYILNEDYLLANFVALFEQSTNYRDRCALLNSLGEYTKPNDRVICVDLLEKALVKESFKSVKENGKAAIEEIKNQK